MVSTGKIRIVSIGKIRGSYPVTCFESKEMSEQNKVNLLKGSEYLHKQVKDENFRINTYGNGDYSSHDPAIICGSIACALGHMVPFFGVHEDDYEEDKFSHDNFCMRLFGFETNSEEHSWCFSLIWENADDTRLGAVARMKILATIGLPTNWYEQARRINPLCYSTDLL